MPNKKTPSDLSLLIADSLPKTGGKKSTKQRKGPPRKKGRSSEDLKVSQVSLTAASGILSTTDSQATSH